MISFIFTILFVWQRISYRPIGAMEVADFRMLMIYGLCAAMFRSSSSCNYKK